MTDGCQETPLHVACAAGQLACVKRLLLARADALAQDKQEVLSLGFELLQIICDKLANYYYYSR